MKRFNLDTQEWEGTDEPDEPVTSLGYLQKIYRDENQPQAQRMRAAVEALPYENAKLMAIATDATGVGFAAMLDRAIERTQAPLKLIEARPVEPSAAEHPTEQEHAASELKGPMSQLRRW